jgi:hypothetical protein
MREVSLWEWIAAKPEHRFLGEDDNGNVRYLLSGDSCPQYVN